MKEVLALVALFMTEMGNRAQVVDLSMQNISVKFEDTHQSRAIAECLLYKDGRRKILISRYYWKNLSSIAHEQILFHELGHCVLGRGHSRKPSSLMYLELLPDELYQAKRESYLTELFLHQRISSLPY